MLTVAQMMKKLGLSGNGAWVRRMCLDGRIKGAVKVGRDWVIPETAKITPAKMGRPRSKKK